MLKSQNIDRFYTPQPSSEKGKLAYRVDEFCHAIGICRSNFYYQVKARKIRTVVIGGRRLVPASEVERLLSSGEIDPTSTM